MRVLLVTDFYPPQVGGMEGHVRSLARQLVAAGHRVVVTCTSVDDSNEYLDGIRVVRLRGSAQRLAFAFSSGERRYPPPVPDPELAGKLRHLIAGFRPDVIHVHGWIVYSALVANNSHSIPLVVTLHDYGHFCPKRTLLRNDAACEGGRSGDCLSCGLADYGAVKSAVTFLGTGLGMRQLLAVDDFIAVSSFVRDRSLRYLPGKPIHVIPNFMDPAELSAGRDPSSRALLPERFVLFVGVMAAFKGVDDLLDAFKPARRDNPVMADVELLLLGREHPSCRYESDPEASVRVVYNPPRGMVVEAIHSCACMVVPSRWHEPCPTVVLEGISAGRPVVGTRAGGIPELLEGVTGSAVVPPADPAALGSAIAAACSLPDAQPVTASYLPLQPRQVVEKIVGVYEDAIGKRRREVRYA